MRLAFPAGSRTLQFTQSCPLIGLRQLLRFLASLSSLLSAVPHSDPGPLHGLISAGVPLPHTPRPPSLLRVLTESLGDNQGLGPGLGTPQ